MAEEQHELELEAEDYIISQNSIPRRLLRRLVPSCIHPNDREGDVMKRECRKNIHAKKVSVVLKGDGVPAVLSDALTILEKMEELKVAGGAMRVSPRVRTLTLECVDITDSSLNEGLETLNLTGILCNTPRLSSFILSSPSTTSITTLVLRDIVHIDNTTLSHIVYGLPQLRDITLAGLLRIDALGLRHAVEMSYLTSVAVLDLNIPQLDKLTFPQTLTRLHLKNVHTSDYINGLLTDVIGLTELILDGTQMTMCQLEWDILILENLKYLHIENSLELLGAGFDIR